MLQSRHGWEFNFHVQMGKVRPRGRKAMLGNVVTRTRVLDTLVHFCQSSGLIAKPANPYHSSTVFQKAEGVACFVHLGDRCGLHGKDLKLYHNPFNV
jgi:hypothetical protein